MHAELLSSGPSPSREGNRHPKEAITRLKDNCTYCPERSKLCRGQRLQEKTEVSSSFGLWKVPGRKAELVPGTRTDLASLVGSRPASWPGGRLLLPGLWGAKRSSFSSAGGRIPPCPSADGLRGEHGAFQPKGAGPCSFPQPARPIKAAL